MSASADLMARVKEAAAAAAAAVEQLRDQIEDRKTELLELDARPCSRAEAEARLRQATAAYGQGAARALTPLLGSAPKFPAEPVNAAGWDLKQLSAADLLGAVSPEALTAWAMRELDKQAATLGGWSELDHSERSRERERLADEILALEREEEGVIVVAEEAGVNIHRRPDADVRAVLNLDVAEDATSAATPAATKANRWLTAPPAMGRRLARKAVAAEAADDDDD